jgi:chromosome segregation ATPase
MDTKILNETASAFAALDFSTENARITEIEAEISRLHAKIGEADERCAEITRALVDFAGPDSKAVADALLADVAPMAAATAGPGREDLEAERASLRSGIGELRQRVESARAKIAKIEGQAFSKANQASQQLIGALIADAREAASRIVDIYAALSAISAATKGGAGERNRVEYAVEGITLPGSLLTRARSFDVPAEIVEVLGNLSDKGRALPSHLIAKARDPHAVHTGL